jgi:hypothetical protein
MRVEIVTHCYHYPRLLRYQLSSLVLWPPVGVEVTMTVCFTPEDEATAAVLEEFTARKVARVRWNWRPMAARELCRRSIGRNRAALATEADWVWFADADYWFAAECWPAFGGIEGRREPLVFPREVWRHRSHALGDAYLERAAQATGLVWAEPGEFEPVRMRCAIGGIQIARGEVCRERGYLRESRRFQRPPRRAVFQQCREDVAFRRALGTRGVAVDLPGVFRIRHSTAGRHDPALRL